MLNKFSFPLIAISKNRFFHNVSTHLSLDFYRVKRKGPSSHEQVLWDRFLKFLGGPGLDSTLLFAIFGHENDTKVYLLNLLHMLSLKILDGPRFEPTTFVSVSYGLFTDQTSAIWKVLGSNLHYSFLSFLDILSVLLFPVSTI